MEIFKLVKDFSNKNKKQQEKSASSDTEEKSK